MRLRPFLSAAACLAASLTLSTAYASTISIGLQQAGINGGVTQTVATSSTGSASYSGNFGMFIINSITALGSPITTQGTLDTNSIQIVTSAASPGGVMYVYITEQGLTAPIGPTAFLSGFTSNLFSGSATSVAESTYYSTSNALYTGTLLNTATFTSGLQASALTTIVPLSGTYSETVVYAISAGAGPASVNDTINLSATAVTPEPSSLVLLGTGLIGAATTALRRRKLAA